MHVKYIYDFKANYFDEEFDDYSEEIAAAAAVYNDRKEKDMKDLLSTSKLAEKVMSVPVVTTTTVTTTTTTIISTSDGTPSSTTTTTTSTTTTTTSNSSSVADVSLHPTPGVHQSRQMSVSQNKVFEEDNAGKVPFIIESFERTKKNEPSFADSKASAQDWDSPIWRGGTNVENILTERILFISITTTKNKCK